MAPVLPEVKWPFEEFLEWRSTKKLTILLSGWCYSLRLTVFTPGSKTGHRPILQGFHRRQGRCHDHCNASLHLRRTDGRQPATLRLQGAPGPF